MIKLIYILLIVIITLNSSFGQQADADSTWDLENLDFEDYDNSSSISVEISSGWFPKTPKKLLQIGLISLQTGATFDIADNIRPKAFIPTTNGFSGYNFMKDEEREIREPFSTKIVKANSNMPFIGALYEPNLYPDTDYGGFGFDYCYTPDLPFNYGIRLKAFNNKGMLFSKDDSKSFLDVYGKKQKFTEASIIHLNEWSLNTGINFELPVYGAFISSINSMIGSYYFISAGINIDYVIWSEAYQFIQIADAKDKIRYSNGRDTLHLQTDAVLNGLNRFRFGIDFSFGWKYVTPPIGFNGELFVHIPLTSVIDDAAWKQYRIGYRYKFLITGTVGK